MLLNIVIGIATILMISMQVQSIEFSKLNKCPNKSNSIQIENQGFICLDKISHCSNQN